MSRLGRRPWLLPLVPLYWAGVAVKNVLMERWPPAVRKLGWPVISVGSLSAGGAGKTPVVLMLAELLGRQGVEADVLSRGYGRGSGVVEEVDAAGPAARFGDEPVEMARAGVRVWVGADRWAAGRAAEAQRPTSQRRDVGHPDPHLFKDGWAAGDADRPAPEAHPDDDEAVVRVGHTTCNGGPVHLLDDGFQHRGLGRQLDVVLLTLEDAHDCLLPGGNLREPLGALRRADVVVVRENEEPEELARVIQRWTKAEVWVVRRELVLPAAMPKRPVVFCGIARPEGFLGMLREAGAAAVGTVVKPDHYAYTVEDVAMLVEAARRVEADGFVTTAKDAVKISAEWRARLEEVGPLVIAGLRVRPVDEAKAMETLGRVCGFSAGP